MERVVGLDLDNATISSADACRGGAARHLVTIVVVGTTYRPRPEPAAVLDLSWHLSYSFLIRVAGTTRYLSEMYEARRAQLVLANPFPDRWHARRVPLEDFAAVDAALHHDGTRWWLLCANHDSLPEANLYLLHSEQLTAGWRPHPDNPIRCELRNSRPAGPLFTCDDGWWRPTQDCSSTYGSAIVLNRILEPTPTWFREEAVARLAPDSDDPYADNLHILCPAGSITLIDGKRHVMTWRRLPLLARGLWRRASHRRSLA